MKKTISLILASVFVVSASALTVSQPQLINIGHPVHNPVLSADGNTLLFSSDDHTGLSALNMHNNAIIVLDEATGSGFNPIFSSDGTKVVYQTASFVDGLMNRDVRSFELSTGTTQQIAPMGRNNINLNDIAGHVDYVFANYDNITVSREGKIQEIHPIANAHSYLWASISPDGNKILFVEPFQGVFICDLDGSNLVNIAKKGAFPAWAGENLITYTLSHDDGYVILDSTLKIHDITTGITLDLTPSTVQVGESASSSDGTVVYTTLDGELYKFNVK